MLGVAASACDSAGSPGSDADDDGAVRDDGGDVLDGEAVECIDLDRDGRGPGCAAGLDCDDADGERFENCEACFGEHPPAGCVCLVEGELRPCYEGPPGTAGVGQCAAGTRRCDATRHLGAECSGQTLPAGVEICGDGADNDCNGIGDEEVLSPCGDCDATCRSSSRIPPAPGGPGSSGIETAPDGRGVILGVDEIDAAFVWVPNTAEGSVSRLDIATGREDGRYRVGQIGNPNDAPSRTAVDEFGDLYVATMANVSPAINQGAVTKIAGDRFRCVDRNRNGFIDTSAASTRLPLGTDECVLWTAPVCEPGGIPRAIAIDATPPGAGSPWVGCFGEMRFHRLDSSNGAVAGTLDVEVNPFGAAAAPGGWIWVSGRAPDPGYVQRFHAPTGGLDPAIAAPPECDPFGVAADAGGGVWIGGTQGHVCRYDPAAGTWTVHPAPRANAPGVAVDPDGNLWTAAFDADGTTLVMLPAGDPASPVHHEIPGASPYGVAADRFGNVWTVNRDSNSATRFVRATLEAATFPVGPGPLAYSAFTGLRRTIVATSGVWVRDFERCDGSDADRWGTVTWGVDLPGDAGVTFVARSAATADELGTAPPVTLAVVPPPLARVDIEAAFSAAGVPALAFIRLEATLLAGSGGESPALRWVEVRWHCGT
ncbi:MAG: hypothetical protein QME96_02065 [Myxococcota bacterium]|nr:hypothetical protein [Myxococcota bacterium]